MTLYSPHLLETYREQTGLAGPDAPKISVAIAALNESYELEATIASFFACDPPPFEIVVYDDNSRFPVPDRLRGFPVPDGCDLRVLRNEGPPKGSGKAKSIAAAHCVGDLTVIADSHVRVNRVFTRQIAALHRDWPKSVLCPRMLKGNYGSEGDYRGCRLEIGPHGYWRIRWREHERLYAPVVHATAPVPSMGGGCYVFPREVLQATEGYCPWLIGWGLEEETMSLLAWLMGFDVRLCFDLMVRHTFWDERTDTKIDREGLSGAGPGGIGYNAIAGLHLVAPPATLRAMESGVRFAWPEAGAGGGEGVNGDAEALWSREFTSLRKARGRLERRFERSFSQVAELIGLPVPTSPTEHAELIASAIRADHPKPEPESDHG